MEFMASRLRNNKDIKGFQIKIDEQTHSIKISQLADDTTLFCTSKEEIYLSFNEIETFGSFSGLFMNNGWVSEMFKNTRGIRQCVLYQLCCLSFQWKSWFQDLDTIKILRDFK